MSTGRENIESELRDALDEIYRPAPNLGARAMASIRGPAPRRRPAWSFAADIAVGLVVILVIATVLSLRLGGLPASQPQTPVFALPRPVAQAITRIAPASQVAWIAVQRSDRTTQIVGVDPSGKGVGAIDAPGTVIRAGDGKLIIVVAADRVTTYSALTGAANASVPRAPGDVAGAAVSPNGRWLALLLAGSEPQVEVIDLIAGTRDDARIAHDPNAALPGLSGQTSGTLWGTLVFAPDSERLYALTDWGGPLRVTALSLVSGRLFAYATAADGEGGRHFPACPGPALVAKVVTGSQLVAFCNASGSIWFIDLPGLNTITTIQASQKNPFWLAPIFTPDGQLLYLHQWPGFGDEMQVVELLTHRLLGPVRTPTRLSDPGPFAGIWSTANAGGTASTVPISPDGLRLYTATSDGVVTLRIPDLKPLARVGSGNPTNEVWVSGDGRTLYATSADGKSVLVMAEDGSSVKTVPLSGTANAFVASEHG